MKAIKLLLCFSLFIFSFLFSYGQSWDWAKEGVNGLIGQNHDEGNTVASDKSSNAYLVGSFLGSLTFDTTVLTCTTLFYDGDAFLVKYDSSGNFLWAKDSKSENSNGDCFADAVATDNSNNAYITGFFVGSAIFGSDTLMTINQNLFLAKYDMNGNVLWAESPKGNSWGGGSSIYIDHDGNAYLTGNFADTSIFGKDTLTAPNNYSAFLTKFNSSGNVLWAKQAVVYPKTHYCSGYSNVVDRKENIYIVGTFTDTVRFGNTQLISPNYAVFIAKYDSNGNIVWAKQAQTLNNSSLAYGISITSDISNNTYITGYFTGTVNFGSHSLTDNSKNYDFFITKYNSSGNVLWAKSATTNDSMGWVGSTISSDTANHLYLSIRSSTSYFNHASFIYGTDSLRINTPFFDATVIIELDTAGNYLCGTMLASGGDDQVGATCDKSGKYVYMGGDFEPTNYPIILGNDSLEGHSNEYPFVARWQPCEVKKITGTNEIPSPKGSISLFPNPNNGVFQMQANSQQLMDNSHIEVYNMLGEKVYSQFSIINSPLSIDLNNQPNGVYLYRVTSETGALLGDGKFVIEK